MTDRIIGKVADVTSDREVIINRGTDHGVDLSTYFYIKDKPIDVLDPDTGEQLGSVTPIKVVVRVAEVSERFCIARTFRTHRVKVSEAVQGSPLYQAMRWSSLGSQLRPPQPAQYETRVETFRLDPKKGEPINLSESVVNVGDVAESVLEDEDIDPVTTTLFR